MYTGVDADKECDGSKKLLGAGRLLPEVRQGVLELGSAHDPVDWQGREVCMAEACEKSFAAFKDMLSSAPVLVLPEVDRFDAMQPMVERLPGVAPEEQPRLLRRYSFHG